MAGSLDDGVVNGVTNANFKVLADQIAANVAANQNLQLQQATSHQNRMNAIMEASIGQIVNRMNSMDIEEALSITQVSNSDLAKQIADLSASIAAIQQMMKGAQTTLPVSANPVKPVKPD